MAKKKFLTSGMLMESVRKLDYSRGDRSDYTPDACPPDYLSVSNIALNDPDDFDAPLSFATCLLGWLFRFLRKEYEPYVGEYTMEDVRKMVPGLFE